MESQDLFIELDGKNQIKLFFNIELSWLNKI